jgi:hypothetical protein
MSRIVPAEELDLIERVISEHPEGFGISALERALADHLPINRRTLQRRLKRLQEDRRIITEGESIALVYKKAPDISALKATLPALKGGFEASINVPVSPEGRIIRDLVGQPLIQRKPVGYQRSFLEEYEPGVTFYLSESLRNQFHEMGRTSEGGALQAPMPGKF